MELEIKPATDNDDYTRSYNSIDGYTYAYTGYLSCGWNRVVSPEITKDAFAKFIIPNVNILSMNISWTYSGYAKDKDGPATMDYNVIFGGISLGTYNWGPLDPDTGENYDFDSSQIGSIGIGEKTLSLLYSTDPGAGHRVIVSFYSIDTSSTLCPKLTITTNDNQIIIINPTI